jgi:RHS repeat-associated protein
MTSFYFSATRDQYYATANIYDASGNRAWKLGGEVNWMWNNGQGWQAYGDLNLRTWYQSDLALRRRSATSRCQGDVVYFTDQAMTKHYFISGQRIASKLAESLAPEVAHALKDKPVTPLSSDLKELGANMAERIKRDFNCVGLDYNAFYPGEPHLKALENLLNAPEQPDEYQVFFYHSDHLGSSSFITDINGDATQHLQYLPFGEDFVHQQNTAAYYTPYTFSGKERDVETSLSYFGARYYEAGLSVWLSVDPMSDERQGLSPYNYCQWNPIRLVDPTGLLDQEGSQSGGNPTVPQNPTPLPTHPTLPNMNSGSTSQEPIPSLPQRVQSIQSERTVQPGTPLQTAGKTVQAVGLVADATAIGLKKVKPNAISYTTPNGSNVSVATSTLKNGVKAATTGVFFTGLAIDVVQTASGEQTPGRLIANTIVGGSSAVIGGVLGLAIAGGYGVLSMTGVLDGPIGPAQSIPPTLMSLPDASFVQPRYVKP